MNRLAAFLVVSLTVLGTSIRAEAAAPAAPPTPQQRVAQMQQWLKASQAQLRAYQWIETTAVTMDGEEKSRKLNTCYYGADGKLQKVPVGATTQADSGGGPLRKKIAASKKEEMTTYMQSAVALVRSYLPPDPNSIQQAVAAGKFSVAMVDPGRRVQIIVKDYLKPGDSMSIDMELPTNRLLGAHIASYLADAQDPVQLDAVMNVLPDGTIYTSKTTLDAPTKKMSVTVENSGYRRIAG